MNNGLKHATRTLLRLIVGGAFTALIDQFAHGLSPASAALILAGWQIILTYAQTSLEDAGKVPPVLSPTYPTAVPVTPIPTGTTGQAS